MIAYVEGPISHKNPAYVIIDVHGIGYQLHISLHTYEHIVNLERCRLLTQPVIRDELQQLYGFFSQDEKELFTALISVSGIAPNTARMMLSSLPPEELKKAIIREDISLIKSVKGVGIKTAQRLVVELRDTLKKTSAGEIPLAGARSSVMDEALAAMTTLGFARPAAEKVISKIMNEKQEQVTVEELIKQALKAI